MWPALILAASRTDNVIGRSKILVVSIRIKAGLKASGAPVGRRWAAAAPGLKAQPDIRRDAHRGRAKVKVITRWLLRLNA